MKKEFEKEILEELNLNPKHKIEYSSQPVCHYVRKAIQLTSKKKDEEFDEFIKKLDWDKDDYDLIKSRVEQSFGTDVNRSLWEYVFNQVCLVFKKKIDELSGEL